MTTPPRDETMTLEPCPFCGGRADYEQTEGALREVRWTVGCLENENSNNLCMAYQSLTTFATKREARLAWNTRHRSASSHQETGWRTIDSAPKDGTPIDIWAGGWRFPNCKWGRHDAESRAPWGDEHWRGLPSDYQDRATHWMPLPEPPK